MQWDINSLGSLTTILSFFLSLLQIVPNFLSKQSSQRSDDPETTHIQAQKVQGHNFQNTGTAFNYQSNTTNNVVFVLSDENRKKPHTSNESVVGVLLCVISIGVSYFYSAIPYMQILSVMLFAIIVAQLHRNELCYLLLDNRWRKIVYFLSTPVLSLLYRLTMQFPHINAVHSALAAAHISSWNEYREFLVTNFISSISFVFAITMWTFTWLLMLISQICLLVSNSTLPSKNSYVRKFVSNVFSLWRIALSIGLLTFLVSLLFTGTST